MNSAISIVPIVNPRDRSILCRSILGDLPEWFGRPDVTAAYVDAVASLPAFAAATGDERIGFASLRRATDEAYDIHVMGVLRAYHGLGAGRALVAACADCAREAGAAFLTVQTVGPGSPNPHYAGTRLFYRACGMVGIAEFRDHWGPETPMLLMGMSIRERCA